MKTAYRSKREAERVRRLRQQAWGPRLYVYQEKGWWYLTSMDRETRRAFEAERKKNDRS